MKTFYSFIAIFSFSVGIVPLFAAEDMVGCDMKNYACYTQKVIQSCTKVGLPWTKNPDLGKTSACEYPDFSEESLKSAVNCMENADARDGGGFLENLNLSNLGNFPGFRTTEIARKIYRKNMNAIFSCAVIASRQDKLTRLEESIRGNSQASDIQKSLEKERKKYESIMSRMNCNQNRTESAEDKVIDRLSSSAMQEYCSYTYYLDYLEANLQSDFSEAEKAELSLRETSLQNRATTTEQAGKIWRTYQNTLESERSRAHETVPKAILAYQEMDRTYIAHILLVIIFDDYLKLRENLDTYLALISQTFEKAYNAQDARQR